MEGFVTGLGHIGIPTNDMKESVAFYEKLGFKNVHQAQNGDVQVVFLQYESCMLELYENGKAVGKNGAVDHFALDTKNADVLYNKMKEEGYTMLTPGVVKLPFWEKGIQYFIIEGPNKERIEFCEILN